MNIEILPQSNSSRKHVDGLLRLPPDKSIFHRLLIIGSLSNSVISIPIDAIEDVPSDVFATILGLQSLGVSIEISRSNIIIQGVGLRGYHQPKHKIHCANSGTTARLFMGLLASQNFTSILTGDDSLSNRPMKRLAVLLNNELGADITTSDKGTLPVFIRGKQLHSGNIFLQASSAQMKTSAFIAGICSHNEISVTEPYQSRDHSERMLNAFGVAFKNKQNTTTVFAGSHFTTPNEFIYHIPRDISSAAFLIAATVLLRKDIILHSVGLNPTRKRFLDILIRSGLSIDISNVKTDWNEEYGTIEVHASDTRPSLPFEIKINDIPLLIDELPLLVILAAFCSGITTIDHIHELRLKESDRIAALVKNLTNFGAKIKETKTGIEIYGDEDFIPIGKEIEHFGDHRIAMALSIMALRSKEKVTISAASVVSVSYPNFFSDLSAIVESGRIRIL